MTGAMYAAIAGLRTHMQNLNVIGNNVANVNTNGYKSSRSVFRTSIYTTLSGGSNGTVSRGGMNPSQIGYGANMSTVDIDMSTGNYGVTGNPTDCMLDGDGFFLVGSKDIAQNFTGTATDAGESGALTSLTLTRVGDFEFKADGYLCDDKGNVVYGFLCTGIATLEDVNANPPRATKVGDPMFSDQLVPLRKPRVWKDAQGGMHMGYPSANGTLDANDPANTTTPGGGGGGTGTTPTTQDTKHILDYGAKLDANGDLIESEYSIAEFTNLTIDSGTGMITATCNDLDGQVVTIGCIAVGLVSNPNGVTQIGNSYYKANRGSGELVISALGGAGKTMGINYVNGSLAYGTTAGANPPAGGTTTGDGTVNMPVNDANAVDGCRLRDGGETAIISGGLEMSKTDLAQEIANMIVTQRGYQANTRIITVTDSMLEELVNMKR